MSAAILSEWAARVRSLRDFAKDTAAESEAGAVRAVQESAAAGVDPDGNAWAPTKDGRRPLKNAAASVFGKVAGATLRLGVRGRYVFHDRGVGKTIPARHILPVGALPPGVLRAIQEAARRVFRRHMKGP